MLILSRKQTEGILIGDDVRIIVVQVGHDRVRIGIEAPDSVVIMREELVRGKQRTRRQMEEMQPLPIAQDGKSKGHVQRRHSI